MRVRQQQTTLPPQEPNPSGKTLGQTSHPSFTADYSLSWTKISQMNRLKERVKKLIKLRYVYLLLLVQEATKQLHGTLNSRDRQIRTVPSSKPRGMNSTVALNRMPCQRWVNSE